MSQLSDMQNNRLNVVEPADKKANAIGTFGAMVATLFCLWFAYTRKFPWWGWLLLLFFVPATVGTGLAALVYGLQKK